MIRTAPKGTNATDGPPTLQEVAQAYIYGYPIVLLDQTRADLVCQLNASINSFLHIREPVDDTFETIVRPNVDTLYSAAFLDVREGPVILTIPPTDGRYQLVALLDAWSNNFAGVSTVDDIEASKGATFVVAWEGWEGELPEHSKRFDSPTPLVWILIRTSLLGGDDLPSANAIQDAMSLEQLNPGPPNPGFQAGKCPSLPPPEAVESMSGVEFFSQLSRLLKEQGALLPGDAPMLRTLRSIGVGPLSKRPVEKLSFSEKSQLQAGATLARKTLRSLRGAQSSSKTGWSPSPSVPLGDYGTDYLLRAIIATVGFGANRPEFAVYQNTDSDDGGTPLDGQHVYTLTFPANELPPVKGFWSLTVYNSELFLAANALDRFALGSTSDLVTEADGSTVIVLSNKAPVTGPLQNWLPVPDEPFALTLRMYGPSEAILTEEWSPPRPKHAGR